MRRYEEHLFLDPRDDQLLYESFYIGIAEDCAGEFLQNRGDYGTIRSIIPGEGIVLEKEIMVGAFGSLSVSVIGGNGQEKEKTPKEWPCLIPAEIYRVPAGTAVIALGCDVEELPDVDFIVWIKRYSMDPEKRRSWVFFDSQDKETRKK